TPVWIMRQAGRYLPEYRATRERAGNFLNLAKTPELAAEVTLQPLERFPLDAAIVFSDILTVPDAMGLGLTLEEGVGPRFTRPVREPAQIEALGVPDPEDDLGYVMEAIRQIKPAIDVPLIGFCGSPWTVGTYMVEGGSSRDFQRIKGLVYDAPAAAHMLLDKVTLASIDYLNAQIAAGADAVMVFDTWGGSLAAAAYLEFSLQYMERIVAGVRAQHDVPVILFTKGGGQWLEAIAATGCQALGVDWTCDIGAARKRVGDRVALQGNLDPAVLRAGAEVVDSETRQVIDSFGPHPGHVFNLGHGVTPDIDPERVALVVETVHAHSRSLQP
ncbi:MAG: uroporphyrinogen decarboxylase, partial [Gammaproteobacteria bacterium]|nr:uroporphyrinogen decarboxylase [Gammaproteobacteria bacterium]